MNEMSIRSTSVTNSSSSQNGIGDKADKVSALAALASSFHELIHKVSTNVDTGLSAIAEKQGLSAVSNTRDTSPEYDDSRNNHREYENNNHVAREKDENRTDSHKEKPHNHRKEDSSRDLERVTRDEHGSVQDFEDAPSQNRAENNSATHADRPQNDGRRDESRNDNSETSNTDNELSEGAANTLNSGNGSGNRTSSNGSRNTDVAGALAQSTTLGNGLDPTQVATQASSQSLNEERLISGNDKTSSSLGNTTATAASSKAAGVHSPNASRSQAAGNNGQIQASSNSQNQGQTETANKNQGNIQLQAQQIARALGETTRMALNVNVANESETLTSRPTNPLASGIALAADSRSQPQAGQQQNSHAAAPNQMQINVANGGQAQGNQAQGSNPQNSQLQSLSQVTNDGKGPNGSSNTAQVGNTSTTSVGGESTSNTTSLNSNGQTQQTQSPQQASQLQRNAQAQGGQNGPTAADQVSVRITRALQAGNDRISIRLNPADLGRVEVKMELAHDGRMTAIITADNRDTLELLKRDASQLQKALEAGGLDLDSNNLAFNLRGDDNQTADGGDGSVGNTSIEEEPEAEVVEVEPELMLNPEDIVLGEGRIDVRA